MANMWLVLLAALVAAAQCSPSAPFAQYNATIYLYGNQTTSVSSWSSLPFNETIKQIVWWEPLQFIILFESSNPWIATVQSNGGLLLTSWTLDVWAFGGVAAVQGNYFAYAAVWGQEVYTSWCDGAAQCSHYQFPLPISSVTQVLDLGILAPGSLVLGTDDGLVLLNVTNTSSAWEWVTLTNTTGASIRTSYISKVHVRNDKTILATSREFYSSSNAWTTDLVHEVKGLKETYYYRTPGIIDARPTAFVGDTVRGGVHFGNEVCDNLLFDNGTFLRISGAYEGGLPQRNITCGAQSAADNIWFGTKFGVSVLFPDDTWKYFFGPRWLPGEGFTTGMNVKSLAAGLNPTDASEVVLVATDTGLSVFYVVQWPSMDLKAQHYQNQLPRFIRYGLVSQLSLDGFGNSNQFTQTATANDGLWSSLYLGSQSFRYAASGDPLAKQDAWDAFHGMQMLVNVTGDLNYPARNFIQHATPCPSSYNPSSTMPGFCWNGDTSSDEIVGHLHGYPIFYYLVASTPTEKAAVAATISNILGGIVRNNFSLIDPTTLRPTTWGKWSPAYLNNDPFWYDERGVNGNQILSYLVTGYAITEESIFADAFWELVNDAHYDINIIDLKITQPTDINFSDDELTFLPYLSFLFGKSFANGTANPLYEHLAPYVWKSIVRTHSIVANEKPSLWNAIYAAAAIQLGGLHANDTQLAGTLKDSIWWMQTYPLSQVDWPVNNAVRIDAVFPHVDMGRSGPGDGTSHTLTLFPYDEQSMLRWNSNPFRTQQGGGHSEFDPSPFLYPFWVGRYYQLW